MAGEFTRPLICQMIDANQRWDVNEAITWVTKLAEFHPLWIEEPTCPDDVLGHASISKVNLFVMFIINHVIQVLRVLVLFLGSCTLGYWSRHWRAGEIVYKTCKCSTLHHKRT